MIELEVVFPPVFTRMKKRYPCCPCLVPACRRIGLEQVTGLTDKGEIIFCVGAACRAWRDVLHLKGEIEHLLRRMAIFAAMRRPFRNRRVERVHDLTFCSDCVRATVASKAASTRRSSSSCSVGLSEFRRAFSSCNRACWASLKKESPWLKGQMMIGVDTAAGFGKRDRRACRASCGVVPNPCVWPELARNRAVSMSGMT